MPAVQSRVLYASTGLTCDARDSAVLSTNRANLPKPPENGSKQEPNTDCIEESKAVVLWHAPIGCPVLVKDCSELSSKGLGILGVKLESLRAGPGTAELIKQLVILPAHTSPTRLACCTMSGGCAVWLCPTKQITTMISVGGDFQQKHKRRSTGSRGRCKREVL